MKMFKSNSKKIRGQGMSEYMIIVALIAIAGIVTMSLFGETARDQVAAMSHELAGETTAGAAATDKAAAAAVRADTSAVEKRNMGTFAGGQNTNL
jgi:hypothetical protein